MDIEAGRGQLQRECERRRPGGCAGIRVMARSLGGLKDRSSRPNHSPRRTPSSLLEKVFALRAQRWNWRWRIGNELRLSRATISRALRRAGMNRLRKLDPPPPVSALRTQASGRPDPLPISNAWRASSSPATTVSTATIVRKLAAPAESTFPSPSMTTPGSATPPSCPIRPTSRPCASSSWPRAPLRPLRHLNTPPAHR